MHIQTKIIKDKENNYNIYEYSCNEMSLITKDEKVWIQWYKSDGDFVREGEILGVFKVMEDIKGLKSYSFNLFSPPPKATTNGFFKRVKLTNSYVKDGDVLFTITEDNVENEKIHKSMEEETLNNQGNIDSKNNKKNVNEEDDTVNVKFDVNTIPDEFRDEPIYISKWHKKDGDLMNEGDLLLTLKFANLLTLAKIDPVAAPCSGILEIKKLSSGWDFGIDITEETSHFIILDGETLFTIHKKYDDELLKRLKAKQFENIPNIKRDEFSNKKEIKWETVCGRHKLYPFGDLYDCLITDSNEGISGKAFLMISFNYLENKDYIIFRFAASGYKINASDKIIFLFENNIQLKFDVINNPFFVTNHYKYGKIYEVRIPLSMQDINVMRNENFIKWQINFLVTNRKITMESAIEPYNQIEDLQYAFKKFINDYYEIVTKEIENHQPLIESPPNEKKTIETSEDCFVYLMKDNTNNYYKIGISNSPDYREKTLQSEKPSIEMVCSKKLPNRKIALILEKTLHQTYQEKRIRGEWFQLDNQGVEEIKITLA